MPESLIRENLNRLAELIQKYNDEKVLTKKITYSEEMIAKLFLYENMAPKMTEEELTELREMIKKSDKIISDSFGVESSEYEKLSSLKFTTRKIPKKDFENNIELQNRRKELRDELKSQLRKVDGVYVKRDIFKILNNVSRIRLYDDLNKNMVMSNEDFEKLKYLKEELTKDMKKIANTIYFEMDPIFKMIVEGREQGIASSNLLELVEYINSLDNLHENSFSQVTMNKDELNLLKEKLSSMTNKKIRSEMSNLPENVQRILNHFKSAMEKETYDELVNHSLIVDTLKIESFANERLTSAELIQLKGALKYIFKEQIEKTKQKEAPKNYANNSGKKAKIDSFKNQWLKAHQTMNEEEKKAHLEALNLIHRQSLNGIELTEKEIDQLKGELIEKGTKGIKLTQEEIESLNPEVKPTSTKQEKITEWMNKKIEEIMSLPNEKRIEAFNNLEIKKDTISGMELNDEEIAKIKEIIKNAITVSKTKEEIITEFINEKISELLKLPEDQRKEAFNNLEIKKDTISGMELNDEEIAKIKEIIKNAITVPKTKEEMITEFINEKINELLKLPEDQRKEAFNNLEMKKDTISGMELNDEEIKKIQDEIYTRAVLNTNEKMFEEMSNLILAEEVRIEKMTHPEIQARIEKVKRMSYEQFLKDEDGFKITPEEFTIYHKLWIETLNRANLTYYAEIYLQHKKVDTIMKIEDLKTFVIDEKELETYSLTPSQIEELKKIIGEKIIQKIQKYEENYKEINNIYEIDKKIEFFDSKKNKKVNGVIKGYQLISDIPGFRPQTFTTKEDAINFMQENPSYRFAKYLIKRALQKELESKDDALVSERQKKYQVKFTKRISNWLHEQKAILKCQELIKKKKNLIKKEKDPNKKGIFSNFLKRGKEEQKPTEKGRDKSTIELCQKWTDLLGQTLTEDENTIMRIEAIEFGKSSYTTSEEIEKALKNNEVPTKVRMLIQYNNDSKIYTKYYDLNTIDKIKIFDQEPKRTTSQLPINEQYNKLEQCFGQTLVIRDDESIDYMQIESIELENGYKIVSKNSFQTLQIPSKPVTVNLIVRKNGIDQQMKMSAAQFMDKVVIKDPVLSRNLSQAEIDEIIAKITADNTLTEDKPKSR